MKNIGDLSKIIFVKFVSSMILKFYSTRQKNGDYKIESFCGTVTHRICMMVHYQEQTTYIQVKFTYVMHNDFVLQLWKVIQYFGDLKQIFAVIIFSYYFFG